MNRLLLCGMSHDEFNLVWRHGAGYTSMQEEEVTGGTLERRSTWLSRNVERWGRRKRWRRRLIGLVDRQIDRSRQDRKRCPFCYLKEWKAMFSILPGIGISWVVKSP